MRIERVEEICLDLLRQSENPLMPVSLLFQKCDEEENISGALTEEAFLAFLRKHADIVVVEGVGDDAPVGCDEFDTAGIVMGPRAILKNRIPNRNEMKSMFQMQLEEMRANLLHALQWAKDNKDVKAIKEIEAALENADSLGERLTDL